MIKFLKSGLQDRSLCIWRHRQPTAIVTNHVLLLVTAVPTIRSYAHVRPQYLYPTSLANVSLETSGRDCTVSTWGPWEGCVADDGSCGIGVQQRIRHVTQRAERGGKECPPLKEMRTCFTPCPKRRSLDGKSLCCHFIRNLATSENITTNKTCTAY